MLDFFSFEIIFYDFYNLLTTGLTNKEDFHYKQLSSLLDQANKIQQKPMKSYEDTMGFYNSYNNFKDIKNRICGDENV